MSGFNVITFSYLYIIIFYILNIIQYKANKNKFIYCHLNSTIVLPLIKTSDKKINSNDKKSKSIDGITFSYQIFKDLNLDRE